jgi:hypothetical protein
VELRHAKKKGAKNIEESISKRGVNEETHFKSTVFGELKGMTHCCNCMAPTA